MYIATPGITHYAIKTLPIMLYKNEQFRTLIDSYTSSTSSYRLNYHMPWIQISVASLFSGIHFSCIPALPFDLLMQSDTVIVICKMIILTVLYNLATAC